MILSGMMWPKVLILGREAEQGLLEFDDITIQAWFLKIVQSAVQF